MYIYQRELWPRFHWKWEEVAVPLAQVRLNQGKLLGRMESIGFDVNRELALGSMTASVVSSSLIEGETLNNQHVRSSVARHLGLDFGGTIRADRSVEGIVSIMFDATGNSAEHLTAERLFGWHAALFPTGFSNLRRIAVGRWREDSAGPMQVVSGAIGRERVHYEAPAASEVHDEMQSFLDWFNGPDTIDGVIKAALAHFWFVTIHPFEDGNGRIARAISDMALTRSEGVSHRYYNMSSQILSERAAYYRVLEQTQKGALDITEWMTWFLRCLDRSIQSSEGTLSSVLAKARFWQRHEQATINARQRRMINQLFDGFYGNLTTTKWSKMTKCSHDTALRDIIGLIDQEILVRNAGGGRSTSYRLKSEPLPEG